MKIVIVGCGKVGETLACDLSQEGHDITVIEQNQKLLDNIISKNDITGIVGNGSLYTAQLEANVPNCDIFISVTPMDETNIIAAIIAKTLGVKKTIARVRDPEYTQQVNFLRQELGISMMINPELEAARNIANMLLFPEAISVEHFANGRFFMLELFISPTSKSINYSMSDLRQLFPSLLVCIIVRKNGDVIIPNGNTKIEGEDHIYITGDVKELNRFYSFFVKDNKIAKNLLIIGGGKITKHLLRQLAHKDLAIKVIEKNEHISNCLVEAHPEVEVICADGTNQELLLEERIHHYNAIATLTGIDEENLLISLFALKQGVKKAITKVNRLNLLNLLPNNLNQAIITPKKLVADQIIRLVRGSANSEGSNVLSLYRLADNQVEALQFLVKANSKCINKTLAELKIKSTCLVAFILRNNHVIFPSGQDTLKEADRVLVVTTDTKFNDLDDILF